MSVDATKPTDTDPISEYAEIIRDLAVQVNTNEAAIGGDFTRTILNKTDSYAMATADLNKVLVMNSASATILTLPAVTADHIGKFVRVHKDGAGNVTVAANGTDVIASGGAGSTAVNSESGDEDEGMLDLEVTAAGVWRLVGMFGSWTIS